MKRTWWVWASVLALCVSPTLTQARDRSRGDGGSRHSDRGREHAERRASGGRSESGSRERSAYRRSDERTQRQWRPSSRSSSGDWRYSSHDRRAYDSRRHSYRLAPRYRWSQRSIHIHPGFLPRYRHGYFWSTGYYYPRYYYDYDAYTVHASIRVLVDRPETEVYVDGYYAGIVDDFDGIFQRLNVTPGTHEITLRLDGFQTWRARVYATPEHTVKLHHDMLAGAADEPEVADDQGAADDDVAQYKEREE